MLKVAIFNFKGGTGKSTTTVNLAEGLALEGNRVIVLDLDGQRTSSFILGVDGNKPSIVDFLQGREIDLTPIGVITLSIIPGDLDLFSLPISEDILTPALARLDCDYCLLDCSPGLAPISVQALLTSDLILIPVLCEPAALKGLAEALDLIRDERPQVPIYVLRCRYKSRLKLTKESDEILRESASDLNYTLLDTVIPDNIAVASSIGHHQTIRQYSERSVGAKAYQKLTQEFLQLHPRK